MSQFNPLIHVQSRELVRNIRVPRRLPLHLIPNPVLRLQFTAYLSKCFEPATQMLRILMYDFAYNSLTGFNWSGLAGRFDGASNPQPIARPGRLYVAMSTPSMRGMRMFDQSLVRMLRLI